MDQHLNINIEILREFPGILTPDELRMILNAIGLLKRESGWGEITLVFKAGEARESGIFISQRPEGLK